MVAGSVTKVSVRWSPPSSSAPPAITFGYAIRCSGGTSRSAGVVMKKLRAAEHERVGTARPVDPERGEDLGVLVEGEEDERAEPHEQRAPQPARMLEGGDVAGGLPRCHRCEPTPAPCEEGRP